MCKRFIVASLEQQGQERSDAPLVPMPILPIFQSLDEMDPTQTPPPTSHRRRRRVNRTHTRWYLEVFTKDHVLYLLLVMPIAVIAAVRLFYSTHALLQFCDFGGAGTWTTVDSALQGMWVTVFPLTVQRKKYHNPTLVLFAVYVFSAFLASCYYLFEVIHDESEHSCSTSRVAVNVTAGVLYCVTLGVICARAYAENLVSGCRSESL